MDSESVSRLRAVINRMARQFNTTSTEAGLTPSQASALGVVASRGPLGLAELAEIEGLNPSMLSRIVGKLDDLGLINRQPDPDDLRAAQVKITPDGAMAHERIRAQRTLVVSECLDRLSESTVDSLTNALPALESLAEELRLASTRARA
jgi:DNA-binding MarR family transcriptional regulator